MKCSFCNKEIPRGTGKMFVFLSGKISYFCSNKCEKNTRKLGRSPMTQKWVTSANKNKKETKK